jgi:outer membrane protein assembly factor BamB
VSIAANKSPFKFLDSFTEADRDIFFGREQEVEEVYAKIFQSKILLIYGASGTGKSSIINCGLSNKFMPSDWLQIPVRRGGNILSSMAQQINKFNLSTPLENPARETGAKELKAALSSVFLDHFKPIYLVFDQFEELFIFGSKDEWTAFTETMRYLLDSDLELRFIFIIRGEYLEFLAEFEEMIPGFFDNRVRIEKMTRSKARESIIGPCHRAGIEVEDGVAENLLDKLSPGGGRVELTFLQVFLDKLYKQATERTPSGEPIRFTNEEVERLGQMSDVLAEFVDEQLFKMDNTKLATAVLKSFVSLQGTKVPLTMDQVKESLQKRDDTIDSAELSGILQSLVAKRILKDQDDEGRYELRHDSLAQKIFEKISLQEKERLEVEQFLNLSLKEYQKRGTHLSEDDLTYVAPHLRKLNLSKELNQFIELSRKRSNKQRRRRRNRAILGVIILMLSLASVIGFVYSSQQKNRADALAEEAISKSEEALKQKELAEQERQKALSNEERAEQQAMLANEARMQADQARLEAERQSILARQAKARAEGDREAALLASERAALSEAEALKQSELAALEKENAEHLRRLGLARELAVRSSRLADPELKAQLALVAYSLNKQEKGNSYQPEIYQSLRDALKFNISQDYFQLYDQGSTINKLLVIGNQTYAAADDGEISRVSSSGESMVLVQSSAKSWHFLAASNSENLLLAGNKQGDLQLMDLETGKERWKRDLLLPKLRGLHITGSGKTVYALTEEGLRVLNNSGKVLEELSMETPMAAMAAGPGDRIWLLSNHGELWKYADGSLVKLKGFPADSYNSLAVNASGNGFAAGTESGMIYFFQQGMEMEQLSGHRAAISSLVFSKDNGSLISGAYDRSTRIWEPGRPNQSPINIEDLPNWVSSVDVDSQDMIWIATYGGKTLRFPSKTAALFHKLCQEEIVNLTEGEWGEFIAPDMNQFDPCDE